MDLDLQWHDFWRVAIFVLCTWCLAILISRYRHHHKDWNDKTKDLWYALLMWSLAGMALALEGVLRDSAFGVRLVFITAAAAVSLKGLMSKDGWGGIGR